MLRLIRLRTVVGHGCAGSSPGPEASVRKALSDEHGQHVMETAKELAGTYGLLTDRGPYGEPDTAGLALRLPVRTRAHDRRRHERGAAQHPRREGARPPAGTGVTVPAELRDWLSTEHAARSMVRRRRCAKTMRLRSAWRPWRGRCGPDAPRSAAPSCSTTTVGRPVRRGARRSRSRPDEHARPAILDVETVAGLEGWRSVDPSPARHRVPPRHRRPARPPRRRLRPLTKRGFGDRTVAMARSDANECGQAANSVTPQCGQSSWPPR